MSHVTTGDFGVGSWIERRARITPHHPALLCGERSVTYAELAGRIQRLAGGLRGLGVGRGDRIAWLGPNHPAFLEVMFAAGRLGAMLAPVNPHLGPDELAFVLAEVEPVVVIRHDGVEGVPAPAARHRVVVGGPADGAIEYEALVTGSPDRPVAESVGFDDVFLLPHTSARTSTGA